MVDTVVPLRPSFKAAQHAAPAAPIPFPLASPSQLAKPAAAPVATLPATGGRRGIYGIGDLARELKLFDRPIRAIIETLRALHQHDGLPPPRSPRLERGVPVRGPRAIWRRSLWDAGEIDAWIDGRSPSGPSVALSAPLRRELADRVKLMAVA